MGTVFEELVRKFNEENNEEAGEHWTPRDAVRLMATSCSCPLPIHSSPAPICSTTAPAAPAACSPSPKKRCSSLAESRGKQVIDPPLRPGDQRRDLRHLQSRHAAERRGRRAPTTLSAARNGPRFRTTPSPPASSTSCSPIHPTARAGKKTSNDGRQGGMRDPRFKIDARRRREYSLITRSSDGQMLFLANMAVAR